LNTEEKQIPRQKKKDIEWGKAVGDLGLQRREQTSFLAKEKLDKAVFKKLGRAQNTKGKRGLMWKVR